MSVVPIAAFLAGALLTILLPIALLIALTVWYWQFSSRVPDTAGGPEPRTTTATASPAPGAANPGPNIPETLPPEHGA